MNQKTKMNKFFLPYQNRWLEDNSKIKIWEKSRRIGATYVQAYEDVRDCVYNKVPAVWFSSADESAAREYIAYCEQWTKMFDMTAKSLGYVVIDSEKDVKAHVIEFANGTKIHALSSNPKGFRSKGGKVVIDEYAHHNNPDELWAAARPCITWGYPLRILSTHNGQSCQFYRFIDLIKQGKLDWSLHTTPIQLAVEEGITDKIYGKKTSTDEKEDWLEEQRKNCFDEYTWLQEYCCNPVDEATAFLPYDLIVSCELEGLYKELDETHGDLFVGMDLGRREDLSVIWVLELLGNVKYTRMIKVIAKTPFCIQKEILYKILSYENVRRCCIDETSIGIQFSEETEREFGKCKIVPISFKDRIKEEMAYNLKIHFENKTVYIPPDYDVREDLHRIQRSFTSNDVAKFLVGKADTDGHADRFWALALALHGTKNCSDDPFIYSGNERYISKHTKNY